MTHQLEDCAYLTLIRIAYGYFVARAWHRSGASIHLRSLIESSQSFQGDIELLADTQTETRGTTADLIFISRRIRKQFKSWEAPGFPNPTPACYDEALDLFAVKLHLPSILHACIMNKSSEVVSLVTAGAKLHLLSRTVHLYRYRYLEGMVGFLKNLDTPTSFAMYTSDDFCFWRDAVVRAGVDLEEFIDEEFESETSGNDRVNPLMAAGWSKANLVMLLAQDINPSECNRSCRCVELLEGRTLKQPRWLRFLGLMKGGDKRSGNYILEEGREGCQSGVADPPTEAPSSAGRASPFCFPDHKGCYLCEDCWFKNGYVQHFWSTRDIDPDYVAMSREERLRLVDEEDSSFLLSF